MQIYCKYSGVAFSTDQFPAIKNFTGHACHPLFYAPQATLISLTEPWLLGEFDARESRLLFLSLLNSTGMVEFNTIARPSDGIIETNMEPLLRLINWHSRVSRAQFILPRFSITPYNADLTEIYHWIESWNDIKEEWKTAYRASRLRAALEEQEEVLHKLINSHTRSIQSYSSRLAEWAITATRSVNPTANEIDQENRWRELFSLKSADSICAADHDDLLDLYEYMETNLDHYASQTYAQVVMKHLRTILTVNEGGIEKLLGMQVEGDDFILEDFDLDAALAKRTKYRFIDAEDRAADQETSIEKHNKKVIASSAPSAKPMRHEYASTIEFLKAMSRYNIASKLASPNTTTTVTSISNNASLEELE